MKMSLGISLGMHLITTNFTSGVFSSCGQYSMSYIVTEQVASITYLGVYRKAPLADKLHCRLSTLHTRVHIFRHTCKNKYIYITKMYTCSNVYCGHSIYFIMPTIIYTCSNLYCRHTIT